MSFVVSLVQNPLYTRDNVNFVSNMNSQTCFWCELIYEVTFDGIWNEFADIHLHKYRYRIRNQFLKAVLQVRRQILYTKSEKLKKFVIVFPC